VEPFNGNGEQWNALIATLPGAHLLQTWQWAQLKARTGWSMHPYLWHAQGREVVAAAMVLQRSLSIPLPGRRPSVLYVPKGPLMDWSDAPLRERVLYDLEQLAGHYGAIFTKIDADVILSVGMTTAAEPVAADFSQPVVKCLGKRGWLFSQEQIQFRNTVLVSLIEDEETMLARMKQKTRYNVRLAQKKGVSVRAAGLADLGTLYRMYAETSVRDGFVIRDEAYYRAVWGAFIEAGMAEPLIAEVEGEAVAGVVVFRFAGRAWYLYGMSRQAQREKMPNHLLQWEAMRRAKAAGCTIYDLWGAPDEFNEQDAMWGVYKFKEGLGGQVARTLGAWDYPARPWLYRIYTRALPRVLDVMRRRGRARTQQEVTRI
jgi:peptidoglycan pentaglycine glycine transferase (the first glycine)